MNGNSLSVANGIDAGYDPVRMASGNSPELNDVFSNMFVLNDANAYEDTLFSWAGAEHAQVINAAVNLAEPYHMAIGEHLNDTRRSGTPEAAAIAIRTGVGTTLTDPNAGVGSSEGEKKASFWGRVVGRWTDVNGDANAPGYDEETYGVVLGFDYQISDDVLIGIAGSYLNDDLEFDDNTDEAEIERFTIGAYLSATFDNVYIDVAFSYADDDYEVNRTVQYGGTTCPTFTCTMGASSDYSGDAILGYGEIGYIFDSSNSSLVIQPYVGISFSDVDVDGFTESGSGDLGLNVADGGGKSVQSRLGARLSGNWGEDGGTQIIPELRLEWRHEFENDPHSFNASLIGDSGIGFNTIGSDPTGDIAVVGAGITARFEGGIDAFFEYQGGFGSGYSSHIIQAGARIKF